MLSNLQRHKKKFYSVNKERNSREKCIFTKFKIGSRGRNCKNFLGRGTIKKWVYCKKYDKDRENYAKRKSVYGH